jgi:hypothetical protein
MLITTATKTFEGTYLDQGWQMHGTRKFLLLYII